jgi:hypothetical protein
MLARVEVAMEEPDSMGFEGGCDCGHVRYRMLREPMFVHCCRWCQRESGAAFALNAMIEIGNLELLKGRPSPVDTPSESGAGQKILRCPDCWLALWSHYSGAGSKIAFLRVGTLDQPDRFPPDIHIFTASKQPWLDLSGGAPSCEAYYDRSHYWPEESLRRREALRG